MSAKLRLIANYGGELKKRSRKVKRANTSDDYL